MERCSFFSPAHCFLFVVAKKASTFAGATTTFLFPPAGVTATIPDPNFPDATEVDFHGPTATGDEAAAMVTAPALGPNYNQFPLVKPTIKGKGVHNFDIFHYLGNLSPWRSIPSENFGLRWASPTVPSDCEIVQAHLLHRHGARYPPTNDSLNNFPTKLHKAAASRRGFKARHKLKFLATWKYKLGSELLTPFGRSQLFDLGIGFRMRYGSLLKGFDDLPVFRTTSQTRMVDSALNFAAGFFGLPDYGRDYHQLIEIENSTFKSTLASHIDCSNFGKVAIQGFTKAEEWKKIYLKDARQRLQADLDGFDLTIDDCYNMQSLCAFETVALGYSNFCSLFKKKEWEGFAYANSLQFWHAAGPGSPVGAAMGIGWVQELVSRLTKTRITKFDTSVNETIVNSTMYFPFGQPIYVDATHDITIASILVAMNFTNFAKSGPLPLRHIPKNWSYKLDEVIPFAVNLVGQVLSCPSRSHKETSPGEPTHIRWVLNDGVLPLDGVNGCGYNKDGMCNLGAFVEAMKQKIDEVDYQCACFGDYKFPVPDRIVDGQLPRLFVREQAPLDSGIKKQVMKFPSTQRIAARFGSGPLTRRHLAISISKSQMASVLPSPRTGYFLAWASADFSSLSYFGSHSSWRKRPQPLRELPQHSYSQTQVLQQPYRTLSFQMSPKWVFMVQQLPVMRQLLWPLLLPLALTIINFPLLDQPSKVLKGRMILISSNTFGDLSPWRSIPSESFGLPEALPIIPEDCEIVQAHLLHRHGARYPSTDDSLHDFAARVHKAAVSSRGFKANRKLKFLATWKNKLGSELLTPFGRSQLFDLGIGFRMRYGSLLKGFDDLPVFRTTSQARMVDSALNFAAGFFGLPNYGRDYRQLIEIENSAFNTTLASIKACPNFGKFGLKGFAKADEWKTIYLKGARQRLQADLDGFELTTDDCYNMQTLCAYETVALGYSEFCGLFNKEEWEGFAYVGSLQFWYAAGPGSPMGAAMGIGWIQELVSRLTETRITKFDTSVNETIVNNTMYFPFGQPIYVDATHDGTIASILLVMNFTNFAESGPLPLHRIPENWSYKIDEIAPFAANLVGQVLSCPARSHKKTSPGKPTHIRWVLNDGVLPLDGVNGCGYDADGMCSLDAFVDAMKQKIDEVDYQCACFEEYKSSVPDDIVDGQLPSFKTILFGFRNR
ncbi:hypothetical protein NP233_g6284 [Leucocoprinus birnbaumii]|uniref:Phosphoglycerate mutase-like protein n=1 Tax=Leucocoprinus birnbaumii TaxID=56174 RepID=A0AAD5VU34_9AGAR|nr:hypothetical protein NP233_g6284 [Leucocoprinus birnbaumii]